MSENNEPDPIYIFSNAPLYKDFSIDLSEQVEDFNGTLDMYCPECKQESVFRRVEYSPRPSAATAPALAPGYSSSYFRKPQTPKVFSVKFECSRYKSHFATFFFYDDTKSLIKIGEFPSLADRKYQDFKNYEKELGSYYQEFKTANYLYLHNVGIGSFVYLRRVFEKVVFDVAKQKFESQSNWSLEEYRKSKRRFEDVIDELADDLPEFLINNTVIYQILSKGIHELDEKECQKYFEVLKTAIEEILDDKINQDKKIKGRKAISGKLTEIYSNLKHK